MTHCTAPIIIDFLAIADWGSKHRHRRKLPPNSGGGSWPFPSPPLPSPPLPPFPFLPSLPSLSLSLEVGPPNPARGSGGAPETSPGGVWGGAPAEIDFGAF